MKVLAVDLGASSGRVMRVALDGLVCEELHRFETPWYSEDGIERWDLQGILREVKIGLSRGEDCVSFGVDSWGVDFGLLDIDGNVIADPIRYRDASHLPGFDALARLTDYAWTGIQPWPFNTAAQLLARKLRGDDELARAQALMMLPDLVARALSDKEEVFAEESIASTTELLGVDGKWSSDAVSAVGIDDSLLPPVVTAGMINGRCITVASHDTASAVVATPLRDGCAFLSSGTWSLIGIEYDKPNTTTDAKAAGFSNERGPDNSFRFLKNVMGLWLFHGCQGGLSGSECLGMARNGKPFAAKFDVNHPSLLNPSDMASAIRTIANGAIDDEATLFRCIFENLAASYAAAIASIETLTSKRIDSICVVGGGSRNDFLNELTAQACDIPVLAGPAEATAIGNALVQFQALGATGNARMDGRGLVRSSYAPKVFEGARSQEWVDWLAG